MWKQLAIAGSGGALGTLLRYYTQNLIGGPLGTLTVNIMASFLLGMLQGIFFRKQIKAQTLLFWGTGFCGGFSTMSAFSADANLLLPLEFSIGLLYITATAAISMAAGYAGFTLALAKKGGS